MSGEKQWTLVFIILMMVVFIGCVVHAVRMKQTGKGQQLIDYFGIILTLALGIGTAVTQLPVPPKAPEFSWPVEQGEGRVTIEMNSPSGTWIYYDLDGNGLPDRKSKRYDGPISVYKTTKVSARAIDTFNAQSDVTKDVFEVKLQTPTPLVTASSLDTVTPTPTLYFWPATGTPPPTLPPLVKAETTTLPPATMGPSPTPTLPPIPRPNPTYFDPPKSGDTFKVVNCDQYVTLRATADAYDTDGYKKINKNETVSYLYSDSYGFYYVNSSKGKGYIYAGYLAPLDPVAINVQSRISTYGGFFGSSDTVINGIRLNISTKQDVINKFGLPLKDDTTDIIIKYNNYWFHLSRANGTVVAIEFFGLGTAGPRGISIGMHISDVLSAFSQKNYSVWDHGGTNDYIWYTNESEKLVSPYAYIENDGSAGNGVIKFVENKNHMDVTIENSYVIKMTIYMEK